MSNTPDLAAVATRWIEQFEQLLGADAPLRYQDLFLEDSYWRDVVALTWDTRQFWGGAKVEPELLKHARAAGMHGLHLDPQRSAPAVVDVFGTRFIEVFFAFRVKAGPAKGFVRLLEPAAGETPRAQLFATVLDGLDVAPEPKERHPKHGYEPAFPGETFGEWVRRKGDFSQTGPDVLIVGGSQSGVSLGARFERLGMTSYLIVERGASAGDSWRKRYDALALHTNTPANDLPYIKIPPTWGEFLPKDQWADYLDSIASLLNLNCAFNTELIGGVFDERTKTWEVTLRMAGGGTRVMRPKHLVMAAGGVGGRPRIPALPGLDGFKGEVLHSSVFTNGERFKGMKVGVVGSSTTAHDICLDLFHHGARPTMIQRGPTCVVDVKDVRKFLADYNRVSVEEVDQKRDANLVLPLLVKRAQAVTVQSEIEYAALHDGLRKAGQKLTIGEDKTGWLMKLIRDLSGYYLNVGCSEAIIRGDVKILDFYRVERFAEHGARLQDGGHEDFDAIVLATGYQDQSVDMEHYFGAEVARKVGKGIGLSEDGEYRTMARPTGQPHLWVMFGGIPDARRMSKALALQIIAQMRGLVPTLVRERPGGPAVPYGV
jgi:putative flavoprotein involved in K+ transport